MNKRELRRLAEKIAKAQQERDRSKEIRDIEAQKSAENRIQKLSSRVQSIEEFVLLDDMIQEIFKRNLDK